jgi:hypothetical protein
LPLWIATHPYRGVIHDGRLYTIQALNTLQPGRFAQDLYFRFGSQDSLTNFSLVYRPLVAAFGAAGGHLCTSAVGAAVWVMALSFLMRSLFDDRREALAAVLACIALDAGYGGLNVFHYGEAFATPRIFAEALVMAALALCLREQLIGSALCLVAAAAIHPIMAATGVAVIGVWVAFEDRRWLLAIGLAAMVGVLLAAAGVQPFARLLVNFDPDWFIIVWKRCGFGFLSRWNLGNALHLAAVASTLWVAHALGNAMERRLIVCLGIISAGGLLATFAGGDLFCNVLLVNIQPWRVLWLDTLIANAAIAVILIRLPKTRFSRELFLWTAALSMLTTLGLQLAPVAALTQVLAALAFGLETRLRSPLPKLVQLLFLIAPVAGSMITACMLYVKAETSGIGRVLALTGLAGAALTVLALCEASRPARVFVLCGAAAIALAGVALFDQRTDWQKFVEAPAPAAELNAFVAGSRNIYWDDGVELLWFKLGRPSYYSCLHGSGAMFFKSTAMEYQRRSRGLSVLNTRDFSDSVEDMCFPKPLPGQAGATSTGQLKLACQALPELDAIVLPYPISGVRSQIWVAPVEREYLEKSSETSHFKAYYKYLCEDFR